MHTDPAHTGFRVIRHKSSVLSIYYYNHYFYYYLFTYWLYYVEDCNKNVLHMYMEIAIHTSRPMLFVNTMTEPLKRSHHNIISPQVVLTVLRHSLLLFVSHGARINKKPINVKLEVPI